MEQFQCCGNDSQKGRICFQVSLANRQLGRNLSPSEHKASEKVLKCRRAGTETLQN
jgi:hypothetical protein